MRNKDIEEHTKSAKKVLKKMLKGLPVSMKQSNQDDVIYFRAVENSCNIEEQFEKIKEEFDEFVSAFNDESNLIEEATDLIQAIITFLENHTALGFKAHWSFHLQKMMLREWKERVSND